MTEVWRPVVGYEGLYEVSNTGKVDQLARLICRKGQEPYSERVTLKQSAGYDGYMRVRLAKDGVERLHYVHRVVGMAFIPNPADLPAMNHKDEDKGSNRVDNLEWCDHQYNARYGTRNERVQESFRRNREKRIRNQLFNESWQSMSP